MNARFMQLWVAALDNEASPDDIQELRQILQHDPQCRSHAQDDLRIGGLLQHALVETPDFTAQFRERLFSTADANDFMSAFRQRLHDRPSAQQRSVKRRERTWRPWGRASLAAAIMLCALGSLFLFANSKQSADGPTIIGVSSDSALRANEMLPLGQAVKLGNETLRFAWPNGSQFTVSGPAVFSHERYGPDALIRIEAGSIACVVAPRAPGHQLCIETRNSRTTVLGTRFSVTTDTQTDWVQVTSGTVTVTRLCDQRQVRLAAGQYLHVDTNDQFVPVTGIPLTGYAILAIANQGAITEAEARVLSHMRRLGLHTQAINVDDLADVGWDDDPPQLVVTTMRIPSNTMSAYSERLRAVPVLNLDPSINRFVGLADQRRREEPGNDIVITRKHPITTGLSGEVQVQGAGNLLTWSGQVHDGANVLATWPDKPERACIIVREGDDSQARRVFLSFFHYERSDNQGLALPANKRSWQLFDNSVRWLTQKK